MSTKKTIEEAVAFYLSTHGMPELEWVKFHESQTQVSVQFRVDHIQARQLFCWKGQFDMANEYRTSVEEATVRLDLHGNSEVVELCEDADCDEIHPELADNLLAVYVDTFANPLAHVERVVQAALEACQGPPDTTVWKFTTAGGLTATLAASYDEGSAYLEDYFESGDPESDWMSMEHALEKPFVVFLLSCKIEDEEGEEIGSAYLGGCTAYYDDEASFRRQVIKEYRSDIFAEALTDARKVMPKMPLKQESQNRSNTQCHTIQE